MGGVVMTDYVKAWQCIGCGKIEAPQTCIGVCQSIFQVNHENATAGGGHTQFALALYERPDLSWPPPRRPESCESRSVRMSLFLSLRLGGHTLRAGLASDQAEGAASGAGLGFEA
jgi:hypothetical protein